ncbi:Sec-independent protein translocase protein TatCy [Paenibacillus sp. J2TS4]|nr:Sec-independent protein translocase protein TatCy [Paenibacillus sp. J2TS4]
MTLVEHLTELRKRLIWVIVVLVIAMIGGFFAAIHLLEYFKSVPPASEIEWNAFALWDGINIYMQFAFIIALIVVLPFTLYQIWAFVKPGLRESEQKATLRYIPFTVAMFLFGLAFSYFVVFKMAFQFTSTINRNIGLTETYGIIQYFSFMFNILLPISLLFELPIVVMFLTKLRILNPLRLRKLRRYAYMVLVIIGTVITPPDLISDILVIIPLILLYEFSVFLSGSIYRKQLEKDREWEEEYGEN